MKPLSDQQRLYLVESDQLYRAWREAAWRHDEHRYGMRWKKVGGHEYLIRFRNARGDGKSLGPRSPETESIYENFSSSKARADESYRGLSDQLGIQRRLNRALRLGRLPSLIGEILLALDRSRALNDFRVVGTHALYAYESMAGAEFKMELLASGDVDLLFDNRKRVSLVAKKLERQGLLGLLQKIDPSFQAMEKEKFRAINKQGFMVDLITQDKGIFSQAPQKLSPQDLAAVEVPNLEWLANAPRIEQVVIAANGSPVLMPVSDPRAFALHKAWLSAQFDREPVKKQRDLNQAKMLYKCIKDYLPNYPMDSESLHAMKYLPLKMLQESLKRLEKN